jgi:hypothetical protein
MRDSTVRLIQNGAAVTGSSVMLKSYVISRGYAVRALVRRKPTRVPTDVFRGLSNGYFATAFGLTLSLMSFAVPTLLITAWVFFANSALAATYNTHFPNSENPISEGGNWKNGALDGLDWDQLSYTARIGLWHRKRYKQQQV